MSKDGDSTTSLGNLYQCSVPLMVKVFPDGQMQPHMLWFVPIASCPWLDAFCYPEDCNF